MAALVFVAGISSSAGCGCNDAPILTEEFEGCSAPCGFRASGHGTAEVVSTILPGEHALRLTGPITVTRALPEAPTIDTRYVLSFVTDCTSGLVASVAMQVGSTPSTVPVPLSLSDTPDSSGKLPDYSGATYLPQSANVVLPAGATSAKATAVTLEVPTGTTCTVDHVILAPMSTCSG